MDRIFTDGGVRDFVAGRMRPKLHHQREKTRMPMVAIAIVIFMASTFFWPAPKLETKTGIQANADQR
jgi:hypothetical protein